MCGSVAWLVGMIASVTRDSGDGATVATVESCCKPRQGAYQLR